MELIKVLQILQIVLAIVLAIIILLQQGGGGLGTMFGGSGGESYRSKRGAEAVFYRLTIFVIIIFVVNALAIALIESN